MVHSRLSVIILLLGVGARGEYQLSQTQHNLNLTLVGLTLQPPTTTNNTKTPPPTTHHHHLNHHHPLALTLLTVVEKFSKDYEQN